MIFRNYYSDTTVCRLPSTISAPIHRIRRSRCVLPALAASLILLTLALGCVTPPASAPSREDAQPDAGALDRRLPEADAEDGEDGAGPSGAIAGAASADAIAARLRPETAEVRDFTPPAPESPTEHYRRRRDAAVARIVDAMTVEEKVGQLIVPGLGDIAGPGVQRNTEAVAAFLRRVQPGGVLFFTENIHTPDQVRNLIRDLQGQSTLPLLIAIDEEGGVVSRLTRNPDMPATEIPSARRIGATGDVSLAYDLARVTGLELRALGFNMNFAPVADVLTNPANQVIGSRSYGTDGETVSRFVDAVVRGLESAGISPVLKHYPGHGDTAGDTHAGPVIMAHDLARLRAVELAPFRAGIQAGAPAVMTGHIALPAVTGNSEAATFSPALVDDLLRGDIGFQGLVISDALTMGAVTTRYAPEEAAIRALEAGVDVLLRPVDPAEVHTAVIEAVHSGRLSVDRIDRSVTRILRLKVDYGILVPDDEVFRARAATRPSPEPDVVGSEAHRQIVRRVQDALEERPR